MTLKYLGKLIALTGLMAILSSAPGAARWSTSPCSGRPG